MYIRLFYIHGFFFELLVCFTDPELITLSYYIWSISKLQCEEQEVRQSLRVSLI